MKVISLSDYWHLEVKCEGNYNEDGGCDSVFEINETDIIPRYVRNTLHFVWVCPHCGRLNCVEEKFVPKRVQYNCAYLYYENDHALEQLLKNARQMKLERARRIKLLYEEYDKKDSSSDVLEGLKYPEKILQKKTSS